MKTLIWENTTSRRFLQMAQEALAIDPNRPKQFVYCEDGQEPYCRFLNDGETLKDACNDFASTYEYGTFRGQIRCSGEIVDVATGEVLEGRTFKIECE